MFNAVNGKSIIKKIKSEKNRPTFPFLCDNPSGPLTYPPLSNMFGLLDYIFLLSPLALDRHPRPMFGGLLDCFIYEAPYRQTDTALFDARLINV